MVSLRPALLVTLFLAVGILTSCASETDSERDASVAATDTISPQTRADSVAYRMLEAHGVDAWAAAPFLRFNFGVETPNGTQVIARHLWNRKTGTYRVEWSNGPDTSYVALVNVRQVQDGVPSGTAFMNGTELTGSAAEEARKQAYGRIVNDTYWLLAPLKSFDPGVRRTYLPDSSTSEHDVLRLSFRDVGLTPGDQYWLYVSKETGRLDRWAYHLQGMPDDASPRHYDWTAYTALNTPAGSIHLSRRKETLGAKQAILTNQLDLPSTPPAGAFSNPDPILGTAK